MLKKIAALVKAQGHCVLATCGPLPGTSPLGAPGDPGALLVGCVPHASLMSFCASADCAEFWMATQTDTRKFRNLLANPRAGLLLDDRAEGGAPSLALGVEAERAAFPDAAAEAAARRALLARHPQLAAFLAGEGVALLRLRALRFQLLSGLTEVFRAEAEKMLDAGRGKA